MQLKRILMLGLLFCALRVYAQTNILLKGDTLILPDGAKFWKGEEVTLGDGSMPDRSFMYIYTPEILHMTKKKPLASIFSSRKAIIKNFKKDGEYKHGYSYNILVLDFGDIRHYWCDVAGAVANKELINVYYDPVTKTDNPPQPTQKKTPAKKSGNKPMIF